MDLHLSIKEIIASFLILFAIIDLPGLIPTIITLRNKVGKIDYKKATFSSAVLLIFFMYLGESILKLVGIDVPSFAVAGSFVLFIIAIEMILGIELHKDVTPTTASIIPLAFPLIAGTGSLTTVLSLKAEFRDINIIIGIALNMILVYIVLKHSGKIEKMLSDGALSVLKKVFGVVLLAIAVKLFSTNVGLLFKHF